MSNQESPVDKAMKTDEKVRVFYERNIVGRSGFIGFQPLQIDKKVGLIFYPGALVAAEAYSPIARAMAELGYTVGLASFASNTPPLAPNIADDIINYNDFSHVTKWAISGHSLGGVMSTVYAKRALGEKESKLKGAVVLATYVVSDSGLPDDGSFPFTSVPASLDGLSTPEKIEENKKYFPKSTKYVVIEGGNHTNSYYSETLQEGDNEATISFEEQQELTQQEIAQLLSGISEL